MTLQRQFDIVVAAMVLAGGSPLWAALGCLVWADSGAPVLHKSTRVGRGGRPFTLLKFRSMDGASGPGITRAGDARITRFGRILRRFHLDEVPQLVNVLRGEMSLVGPRPEDPRYVALYSTEQRGVLAARPGIASDASIRYSREAELLAGCGDDWERHYVTTVLPDKLRMDLSYVENRSLWGDVTILARAVACVARR